MIFVDSWAWIALARQQDQYHSQALTQHDLLVRTRRRYVTTDFVLSEVISYLFAYQTASEAQAFVGSVLAASSAGTYRLVHVSPDQFDRAWQMRQKYHDKPDNSFVDFTSMVAMQDLGITEVFTGDSHFVQVGLGFRLLP